ncbi:MAG: hypothetical protein U9N12_10170 [Euryarchaeota archaeon]|nr:hypothetical protein [Euryarchaeota archaeon]
MKKIQLEKLKKLKVPKKLEMPSEISKKTILILLLIVIASTVLGYGVKTQLSQQNEYIDSEALTPEATPSSIWDVFEDEEQNQSLSEQIGEALNQTESADSPEPEPIDTPIATTTPLSQPDTTNLAYPANYVPAMLDSDFVWFGAGSKYASCYDAETDTWLVYESSISPITRLPQMNDETMVHGVFDNRTLYRYDDAEMRLQPVAVEPQRDVWMLMSSRTQSTDRLYLYQLNNSTGEWVGHTKPGSNSLLGSGYVWFDQSGIDCNNVVRNIKPTIHITGKHFSCAVDGGIPPLDYNWASDINGHIGNTGSFDMAQVDGTHNITLRVTDASGASAETTVARTFT